MSSIISSRDKLFWVGAAAAMLVIAAGFWLTASRNPGPPAPELPIISGVAAFSLTNQDGAVVTLETLKGHVWLADVFFTRCAGPCPKLGRRMRDLQQSLPTDSGARLVSLTTDPAYDTPPVLKSYAAKFSADPGRWQFLTGPKAQVAALARESLKFTALEKAPAERDAPADLFIHSTIFALVDKEARLRAFYETEGDDIDPVRLRTRILADIHRLERE